MPTKAAAVPSALSFVLRLLVASLIPALRPGYVWTWGLRYRETRWILNEAVVLWLSVPCSSAGVRWSGGLIWSGRKFG